MKKIMNFMNVHKTYLACLMLLFASAACTDLELEESDSIIAEGTVVFEGVANVDASLTNLYNDTYGQLGDQANFFALNEVSTDEQLVPSRGTDWGDNGVWRTLHAHNWNSTHQYILGVWNNLNQNVLRASQIIDPLSAPSPQQEAEARFLRAFSMYFVLDLWGIAPFRQPGDGVDVLPEVFTAQEAYDFIIADLQFAVENLPSVGPSADTNRASKATANFLMAKAILNSERYTGSAPNYQAVIDAVDAIAADGYALQAGYFDIFTPDVDSETIWFATTSVGNRIWNGMHYNQNSPDNTGGGWNGFTTLAEFYDSFEGDPNSNTVGSGQEERRGFVPDAATANDDNLGIGYGFLIGQQYNADGSQLTTRAGQPLVFTKDLPGLSGNTEDTGIRVIKYHPNEADGGSFRSHEIIFRYADAHLMKAEAMMRMGGDATGMVNDLRVIRGATPLGSVGEAEMLAERGRELYVEFWRRNDMIRFGQYTRDWQFKDPAAVGDETKNLYPIPETALLTNPNLVQNPGY